MSDLVESVPGASTTVDGVRVPTAARLIVGELTAAEVMTPDPVSVTETESVAAAWELLARGNFHHLPVVRRGRCVGVLDDRVLLRAWRPGDLGRAHRRVSELLLPTFVTVSPTDPVSEVAATLCNHSIDAAPVIDGTGLMLGLVTASDLVRVLAGHLR